MRFVADSLCLPWFQYSKPAICCLIHLFLTDSFAAGGVMAVVYRNGSWSTKDRTRQRIYDEYFRCLACKRIVVDTWVILSIVWFFNVCCLWFTSLNTSCLFDPFPPPPSPFLSLFHTAWSLGFGALLHSLFINSTSPSETTRRLSRFRPSHKTPDTDTDKVPSGYLRLLQISTYFHTRWQWRKCPPANLHQTDHPKYPSWSWYGFRIGESIREDRLRSNSPTRDSWISCRSGGTIKIWIIIKSKTNPLWGVKSSGRASEYRSRIINSVNREEMYYTYHF